MNICPTCDRTFHSCQCNYIDYTNFVYMLLSELEYKEWRYLKQKQELVDALKEIETMKLRGYTIRWVE